MRHNGAAPVLTQAQMLRQRWRAASMSSVWLRPGDWYIPEVDAVADAYAEERDPTAALEQLGHARCEAGVGLGETLDDLICLFQVLNLKQAPWAQIRLVAEAWAESQAETTFIAPYTDPTSDLVNFEYLRLRLREIYGESSYIGQSANDRFCLIMIDTAVSDVDQWTRMQRSFAISGALHRVFTHGETLATAGQGTGQAVVLARRDDNLHDFISMLRDSLNHFMAALVEQQAARQPARIWIEPLPDTFDLAVALVNDLAR